MNTINWTKKAIKQSAKLDGTARIKIADAVNELSDFTHLPQVIALINHQYDYRLRVGNYRVLFDYNDDSKAVLIREVKKRDERTY